MHLNLKYFLAVEKAQKMKLKRSCNDTSLSIPPSNFSRASTFGEGVQVVCKRFNDSADVANDAGIG